MAPDDRPNVLFVFPDQHRPDYVGFDGEVPVRTPNLDDLADRGVAFRNAVTPSPLCGPARACLASGREYDRCGVRDHAADYPLGAPTLYARLRDAGYHVIGSGKFDLQKHSGDQGLDGENDLDANGFSDGVNNAGKWDAWGGARDGTPGDSYTTYLDEIGELTTHIEDFDRRQEAGIGASFPTSLPPEAYCDNWIGRRTVDLLEAAPADRPWFCQVNFAGPHDPWDVTEDMHNWYRDPPVEFPDPTDPDEELTLDEHQSVRRNYAAMVENIDRWLGRFLGRVDDRGERENTLVVFASDHGEMLGDHGRWKKHLPYRASAGVPLVAAGTGVVDREPVEAPATILDCHATFLDAAGVEPTAVDPTMDSLSMWSFLQGDSAVDADPTAGGLRDVAVSGFGNWRLAIDERYGLIRGYDPDESQHDPDPWDEAVVRDALRDRDPILFDYDGAGETANVAGATPTVVERLDDAIDQLRSG